MGLSRALEIVEEKEKFPGSSFFLLFDSETLPESAQLLYCLVIIEYLLISQVRYDQSFFQIASFFI
jgi:hypothetical protein